MGRPRIRTPEERQARDRATKQRYRETNHEQIRTLYNERYPTRYKAKAKARHDARIAAMTPEELATYRAANTAAMRRHRAKDPEAEQTQRLAYQRAHPEQHRGYVKKHRLAQVAKNPSYYSNIYYANLERQTAATKKWRAKNPDKVNATSSRYRKAHPAMINAASDRKRARKAGAAINDATAAQREMVIATAHGVCAYCPVYKPECPSCRNGTHKLTVDHITALANGGDHTLHNFIACCHSCNSKKKTNPAPLLVQPLLL